MHICKDIYIYRYRYPVSWAYRLSLWVCRTQAKTTAFRWSCSISRKRSLFSSNFDTSPNISA